jgi:hypothetical protein
MVALLIGLDCIHERAIDVPQRRNTAGMRFNSLKMRSFGGVQTKRRARREKGSNANRKIRPERL